MNSETLSYLYLTAKHLVISAGYWHEIQWSEELSKRSRFTEQDCMREAAWVILSSGMSYRTISAKFSTISTAFYNWDSTEQILDKRDDCIKNALLVFNHPKKIGAILSFIEFLKYSGADSFVQGIRQFGVDAISALPFFGPATSRHLMKNLGIDIAKPDRHLIRIADALKIESVDKLCDEISCVTGDQVIVIDSVLWRFAEMQKDYLEFFDIELADCISEFIGLTRQFQNHKSSPSPDSILSLS